MQEIFKLLKDYGEAVRSEERCTYGRELLAAKAKTGNILKALRETITYHVAHPSDA